MKWGKVLGNRAHVTEPSCVDTSRYHSFTRDQQAALILCPLHSAQFGCGSPTIQTTFGARAARSGLAILISNA